MKFEKVILTALDIRHMSGTSKSTGKPYDFNVLVVGDEDYNRFETTIARDDLVEGAVPQFLLDAVETKSEIVCDVTITPDERNVKLRLENLQRR